MGRITTLTGALLAITTGQALAASGEIIKYSTTVLSENSKICVLR